MHSRWSRKAEVEHGIRVGVGGRAEVLVFIAKHSHISALDLFSLSFGGSETRLKSCLLLILFAIDFIRLLCASTTQTPTLRAWSASTSNMEVSYKVCLKGHGVGAL